MGNRKHSRAPPEPQPEIVFKPGVLKGNKEKYSKRLVVPRSGEEDVGWIEEHFEDDCGAEVYETGEEVGGMHPPK